MPHHAGAFIDADEPDVEALEADVHGGRRHGLLITALGDDGQRLGREGDEFVHRNRRRHQTRHSTHYFC